MLVDLHTHTKNHSECSHQTVIELIQQAVAVGLDGLVITDHDYLWGEAELQAVLEAVGPVPLIVLKGQEVNCPDGHLLVYGMETRVQQGRPRVALARDVRACGGATILPHPFRWSGFAEKADADVLQQFREFEAIEGWTTNHGVSEVERVQRLVGFPEVRFVAASDAHSVDRVGAFATRFARSIQTEVELVQLLREGGVVPVARGPTGEYVSCL